MYGSAHLDPKGYHQYFSADLTAIEIGVRARAAFLASRFITPEHPEWNDVIRIPTKEEFKAWEESDKARAGVRTLKALFNGAGHVSLTLRDGKIAISQHAIADMAIGRGFAVKKIRSCRNTCHTKSLAGPFRAHWT